MDKYAAFIWTAYGVTVLVFLGLVVGALSRARHWKRRAEDRGGK